jgi:nucleotide-binding universal stress UspA family protein
MPSYKHVLCPTDFSSCSDEACAHAQDVASTSGAKLTLLHVVGHFPEDRSDKEIAPENQDPMAYREEMAMASLKEQAARTGCESAELVVAFSTHSNAYGIISYAATAEVDLIVMAAHAQDWVSSVFGDTTKYVQRKAGCDVLVVPSGN